MKKTAAILLLVCLCFNSTGYFVMLSIMKMHVRREIKTRIKESIPKDELKTLVFSKSNKNDFKWHDNNEFSYQGTMFDVVRREKLSNGDIIFYCITDIQETILFTNLGKHVNDLVNSNPKNSSASKLLSLFIGSLYLPVINDYHPEIKVQEIFSGYIVSEYSSQNPMVSAPPPKA